MAPTAQTDLVFDGVTDIDNEALHYLAYFATNIDSVSFPNLTQITGFKALNFAFCGSSLKSVSFPVLQSISGYQCLRAAFEECNSLQSLNFPALVSISGNNAMDNMCYYSRTSLTSVSFPVLKEVTGDSAYLKAFENCSSLTTVQLPMLETVTGDSAFENAFSAGRYLKNISFPKLKTIGSSITTSSNGSHFDSAFNNAVITSLEFPELTAIYCTGGPSSGTFYGNRYIQKMYFPKLSVIDKSPAYTGNSTAQNNIFYTCSRLTEIHFGAANQAAIEATEGYPTLWGRGAGNATVYFDL